MDTKADEPFKVASISFLPISIYAFTADEMGIPTVGIISDVPVRIDGHVLPRQAEELADALKLAAGIARREIERKAPV